MNTERRKLAQLLGIGATTLASSLPAHGRAQTARRDGGEVTFLLSSLESGWGLNERVDTYTGIVWGQIADKLVHVDARGHATGWIAERWDENPTQTEFVLHLKRGVTFSDGTPLDAAAVAANIELWAKGDPSRGVGRLGLFPSSTYTAAEAIDAHTLRVRFSAPTLGFIPTLGYHKAVLRAVSSLNLRPNELGNLTKQLGSGPFTVRSWQEGDNVVLVRRPDYNWGPSAIEHTGPASLERITFKVVRDASIRGSALQAGQADVVLNVAPQEFATLRGRGLKVVAPESLGFVSGFVVNTRAPHFSDVKVRQAVQHAINRQEILDTVFTSDWKPVTTFLQSNVPEAADLGALLAHDPAKSRRLLEEAGWRPGPDGIRVKDGQRLRFNLFASPWVSTSRQVDEVIAQQLRQVGISVNLQVVDISTYNARVRGNDNVPLIEISRSFLDAGVVGNILTSGPGGEDLFRYEQSNDELNRYAAEIANAVDREPRAETLRAVQRHVLEQALFIPTSQLLQRIYVQSPKLRGEVYSGAAYPLYYGSWLER
ncbi:ABC transporter substrate-binding protein [Rhodovarius crocodyli]|uniref:ABC transporter substrate-binding protein n=1 Tax=Rhodovarius crocodyli TaxID=1979269 RepID=A0A437M1P0_9PROT|nr:ABC transporter substrate-binding protein [Rhodovarius crocodyli]RVT91630.1 ABC transporter substrate-binding protein [Rhodovarius crocodyli]